MHWQGPNDHNRGCKSVVWDGEVIDLAWSLYEVDSRNRRQKGDRPFAIHRTGTQYNEETNSMAYGNHVYKPARPAKPAGQILQKALPGRRAGWLDPGSQFWKIWPAFLAARAGFPPYIFLFIYSMLQYIANYVHVYIYIHIYSYLYTHTLFGLTFCTWCKHQRLKMYTPSV